MALLMLCALCCGWMQSGVSKWDSGDLKRLLTRRGLGHWHSALSGAGLTQASSFGHLEPSDLVRVYNNSDRQRVWEARHMLR